MAAQEGFSWAAVLAISFQIFNDSKRASSLSMRSQCAEF